MSSMHPHKQQLRLRPFLPTASGEHIQGTSELTFKARTDWESGAFWQKSPKQNAKGFWSSSEHCWISAFTTTTTGTWPRFPWRAWSKAQTTTESCVHRHSPPNVACFTKDQFKKLSPQCSMFHQRAIQKELREQKNLGSIVCVSKHQRKRTQRALPANITLVINCAVQIGCKTFTIGCKTFSIVPFRLVAKPLHLKYLFVYSHVPAQTSILQWQWRGLDQVFCDGWRRGLGTKPRDGREQCTRSLTKNTKHTKTITNN